MKRILNSIITDIKNGQNIEFYVSIPVAIVVAVLGILGVVSYNVLSATILLLLSILSGAILLLRKSAVDIRSAYDELTIKIASLEASPYSISDIFRRGYPRFDDALHNATEICVLGTSLVSTINNYFSHFEQALNRGAKLRFILSSTEDNVLDMLLFCNYKMIDKSAIKSIIDYHANRLYSMDDTGTGKIEVRKLSYIPPYGLVITKNENGHVLIFVKLFSFRTRPGQYPVFEINDKDIEWSSFFHEQFEIFWEAATAIK